MESGENGTGRLFFAGAQQTSVFLVLVYPRRHYPYGLAAPGGPVVATLFAYFALNKLHIDVRVGKVLALIFFLVLLSAVGYGLGFLINRTVRDLPEIAEKAIPSVLEYARSKDQTAI